MLDVDKLATLRAVITHGSFTAAAQALLLTQPAVSRQVALLERQAGTQLVHRSRAGVRPTEAGRLLAEHTDAVLGRLALAEAQLAELAGLRRGHVRLGSFLTALVHLSAEVATLLEARHPELFRTEHAVIRDELVDRGAAFSRLAAGELDVAIVFEHEFEPAPPPEDIEVVDLFTDPPRLLLPAAHALADTPTIALRDLAHDTWVRAHHGSAARLVDHVLHTADLRPPIMLAGHGDEPVETQAFIAAGRGVTIAHDLNVLIHPRQIVAVAVADHVPTRRVQAAVLRDQHAPLPRAVLAVLEELGARRARAG
ncbi:LysR family transcriptional regulator [Actinophytocola gossypii]|uniref:LysR family transcriptional regulator n=1 Tax=Actinophytocola gossypii TaxID=2812003 RepID=A0ABT2J9P6_9PSEU|nr:LysR family transcriptional regulator [Actinophytocola gossypii]MCT2584579.1 LysR family transcriptional regulator [Actinophytocola gossypii]